MNLPDGSLCRVTSSAKDLINNVQIIKVPDSDPTYRLVLIRPNDEDKESSEESDEEISESEDEFLSKAIESERLEDKKLAVVEKSNKAISEEVMRGRNYRNRKRYREKRNKYSTRNNNFNNNAKQYKSRMNRKKVFEYGDLDLNSSSSRDFNSKAIPNSAYKNNDFQHFSTNSHWAEPPVRHPNHPYTQFPHAILPEKPRNSFGFLGERPLRAPSHDQNSSYTPMASKFQLNTNNDPFICDQTSINTLRFQSIYSNSHNNSFGHNQSPSFPQMASNSHNSFAYYQNSSYSHMTSSYPPNKQADNFIRDKNYWNGGYSNYHENNQFPNKHLNVDDNQKQNPCNKNNRRQQNSWNKNHRRQQNVRNNASFDCRN